MLLPSAFSCETSYYNAPRPRFQPSLFASPPTSPRMHSTTTIFTTCCALQSMLSSPQQLPTPPMSNATTPGPTKLRLRSKKQPPTIENEDGSQLQRRRIAKRVAPPRGINKRRRELEDVSGSDADDDSDVKLDPIEPCTPKRLRFAPAALPLGLERSDFHTLHLDPRTPVRNDGCARQYTEEEESDCDSEWTNEEDRFLVELVLEKLKLSKSDWQDCARSLGKDRGSVGKRWKSLMGGGEVGLKGRGRRGRIHATWR